MATESYVAAASTSGFAVFTLPNIPLVHGYLDIDHGRLFDELAWIEQTEEFAAAIEHWLEQNVDQA